MHANQRLYASDIINSYMPIIMIIHVLANQRLYANGYTEGTQKI